MKKKLQLLFLSLLLLVNFTFTQTTFLNGIDIKAGNLRYRKYSTIPEKLLKLDGNGYVDTIGYERLSYNLFNSGDIYNSLYSSNGISGNGSQLNPFRLGGILNQPLTNIDCNTNNFNFINYNLLNWSGDNLVSENINTTFHGSNSIEIGCTGTSGAGVVISNGSYLNDLRLESNKDIRFHKLNISYSYYFDNLENDNTAPFICGLRPRGILYPNEYDICAINKNTLSSLTSVNTENGIIGDGSIGLKVKLGGNFNQHTNINANNFNFGINNLNNLSFTSNGIGNLLLDNFNDMTIHNSNNGLIYCENSMTINADQDINIDAIEKINLTGDIVNNSNIGSYNFKNLNQINGSLPLHKFAMLEQSGSDNYLNFATTNDIKNQFDLMSTNINNKIEYIEDFINGATTSQLVKPTQIGANAGTTNIPPNTNSQSGVIRLSTGTTVTGGASLVSTNLSSIRLDGGTTIIEFKGIRINCTTPVGNGGQVRIGLIDVTSPIGYTDGLSFNINIAGAGTSNLVSYEAISNTNNNTLPIITLNNFNQDYNFKIVVNSSGTQATYYINNISVGTMSAPYIPLGVGRETGIGLFVLKTSGTTPITVDCDAIIYTKILNTSR